MVLGAVCAGVKSEKKFVEGWMLEYISFARRSYHDARSLQEAFIQRRIEGKDGDKIIFCEHPAVLTLGKRTTEKEREQIISGSLKDECEIVPVLRGGQATYHGPGQLVIYPVIKLPDYRLGVKRFVLGSLEVIADTLAEFGIKTKMDLVTTGLYCCRGKDLAKIAFSGLQIIHGVTNHGFSLNVRCNLEIFSRFNPCGNSRLLVTDMESCGAKGEISLESLSKKIFSRYVIWLTTQYIGNWQKENLNLINVSIS